MGNINQVNNFQNSKNGNAQNFTNANIINQTNYINTSSVKEIYVSLNLSQEQKNKINQDKYLKDFKDAFQYLNIEVTTTNTYFSKYNFILDFYFNFLSSLKESFFSTDNSFNKAFDMNLYKSILKNQKNQSNFGFDTDILLIFLNENSEKKIKKEDLEKDIQNNDITYERFECISNSLCFIKKWGQDMYLFINYLIETDFELFINSNNEELLYHAIGFLVYSNNIDEKDNLLKVDNIYAYFGKNKNTHKINKEAIKNIISDFDAFIELQIKEDEKEEDFFMKTYGEFPQTIHKQEKLLNELKKNIINEEEIKAQKLELQKKLNQIKKEKKKIEENLTLI